MSQDIALPIGRYVVGAPRQAPFGETGEIDSYSGVNNGQQNRILSGRMPTTRYNSAIPSIRATEENNGGSKPQIVSPSETAGGAIGPHPWRITFTDEEFSQFIVEENSFVFTNFINNTFIPIQRINTPINASFGKIYLRGNISNNSINTITITDPLGSPPNRSTFIGSAQSQFNFLIGEIYDNNGPQIRQYAFQNLTLFTICSGGLTLIYPI